MTKLHDEWIAENSPIEPEKLHAIGVITYRWNACELGIRLVLFCLTGPPFGQVWADTSNQRPSKILDAIKNATKTSAHRPEVKDAILHAVALYDVNGKNRNQFSHFLASGDKSGIALYNKKSPDFDEVFDLPPIPSDLADFRRVADEVTACMHYLTAISNYLIAGYYRGLEYLVSPPPLPAKPPVPKIHWKPPPRSPEGRQRRP